MKFDWQIYLHVEVDVTTGLPVVGLRTSVPYNPQDFIVPEKYREFLKMGHGCLHGYTHVIEEDTQKREHYVGDLLHYFPDWKSVTESYDLEDWTYEKHYLFFEALNWFASKECFMASWDY